MRSRSLLEIFVPATGAGPLPGFSKKEIGACIRLAIKLFEETRSDPAPSVQQKGAGEHHADHAGIRLHD
jgi:hypothetical protein